ncbi:Mannose-6-phosphate isomerase, cupin superfamily [Paenibacillus sp. UNCCL117]|uniref:cupin domain-containing protein n=1 Tax=unclassified Paenibacillus TaxID=185978 RepID=UPI0008822EA8|nr:MULTISPECIES: cupin domain-containing protein [unclassified Paenibacillus]SDE41433.1 Mannose-6-phosphate isomerase, cupin superfamily [Paenibacillus sp. cl123]SFW65484.1 Mannose-6-phosphate isomerase, cupin superfamily [Paenibacillus sp. UNCCL117]
MQELQQATGQTLKFVNGNTITLSSHGTDQEGEYLILEHTIVSPGAMNGPHSHPVLDEKFTIIEGTMRFLIDDHTVLAGPGEQIHIKPGQIHQAWNESQTMLRVIHEIRPPGQHWNMFRLLHKLEAEGKLNAKGIPRNPLWMGLAWTTMDGYIAGPPRWIQHIALGGLARIAKAFGYRL